MDIVEGELNQHANYNGWTQETLEAAQDYLHALYADPEAVRPSNLSASKASVVKSYMDQFAGVS